MNQKPVYLRTVVTSPDRIQGRHPSNPTLCQDSSLWKASRLHNNHSASRRMRRQRRKPGILSATARIGRQLLMAVGLL